MCECDGRGTNQRRMVSAWPVPGGVVRGMASKLDEGDGRVDRSMAIRLNFMVDCVVDRDGALDLKVARVTVLLAFSSEQVSRLTGLSERQLRYWDDTGFFTPSISNTRGKPFGRIYSFRDVVGLRTIAMLRNQHRVPLQELRKVGMWLEKHYDEPWASLRFYVSGGHVYFDDPEDGYRRLGVRPEQIVITIEMKTVAASTAKSAERLRQRDPGEIGRVQQNRYVSHNQPVIAGTRIRVEAIWNFHEAGYDTDAILAEYPRLTRDDVEAAIECERQRRQRVAG